MIIISISYIEVTSCFIAITSKIPWIAYLHSYDFKMVLKFSIRREQSFSI